MLSAYEFRRTWRHGYRKGRRYGDYPYQKRGNRRVSILGKTAEGEKGKYVAADIYERQHADKGNSQLRDTGSEKRRGYVEYHAEQFHNNQFNCSAGTGNDDCLPDGAEIGTV